MSQDLSIRLFDKDGQASTAVAASALGALRTEDPDGFVIDADLASAINAAMVLGQPLLLTGETGVGKTSVGRAVAHRLGLPLLEFTVKSTSKASDLFYEYDAIGRFHAAEAERANAARLSAISTLDAGAISSDERSRLLQQIGRHAHDPRAELLRYLKVRALGRAVMNASTAQEVALLRETEGGHAATGLRFVRDGANAGSWVESRWTSAPMQSVVIIDEIDKAPLDFANDLLDELDTIRFQVPELANHTGSSDAPRFGGNFSFGLRPIVFITSNQERQLPDAFLRRCCYHHIPAPTGEVLEKIIRNRLGDASGLDAAAIERCLGIYDAIKDLPLLKRPGLAELLSWLRYIGFRQRLAQSEDDRARVLEESLTALLKGPEDRDRALEWLRSFAGGQ